MTDAQQVLRRFSRQISKTALQTVRMFEPSVEYDDAWQEASIFVCTYAGLMPGRLHGKLGEWERLAGGNGSRVKGLLATQLRRDLFQLFGRAAGKNETCVSLENLPPQMEPRDNPEDRWIARIDHLGYVRRAYPYLAMAVLDEMTEDVIAVVTGESVRTIRNRLPAERRKAAEDPYFVLQDETKRKSDYDLAA